jgi:hypothetical protein
MLEEGTLKASVVYLLQKIPHNLEKQLEGLVEDLLLVPLRI